MKRILLAIVAVTALTSVSALAADLPARMPVKAALVNVPYNWTGTYIGLNLGGAFGSFKGSSSNLTDVTGGGQIGYNWQASGSPWVFGLEADFSGSGQSRTERVLTASANESLPYFGTVRGRLGYAFDRAMVHATGGLAYQNFRVEAMSPGFAASSNSTNVGYAIGGGSEWALWDRWTAKIEYVYLNTDNTGATTPVANFAGRVANNVVRSGLNYHF
jgi:outer membrane immunogenic protein